MKKFGISALLFSSLFVGLSLNSCKDEFSEEDALNLQNKLNKENGLFNDSLNTVNYRVSYTVTVVDASTSTLKSASAASAISTAVVKLIQDTTIITRTVDAAGLATFTNLKPGRANVNITLKDYSEVNYAVNLNDNSTEGGRQFSNIIPLIPVAGTGTGVIKGRVTYESDLTNATSEAVPAGTKVLAMLNTNMANIVGSGNGSIESLSYNNLSLSAVTGENGNFSMEVPATIKGLEYNIIVPDFTADQKILMDSYLKKDTFGLFTIPTNFGNSFTAPSTVKANKYAVVKIGEPDYKFTEAKATAVIDGYNGLDYIIDANVGSKYEYGTYYFPIQNPEKTATATIELSVDGNGHAKGSVYNRGSNFANSLDGTVIEVPYIEEHAKAIVTSVSVTGGITGYKIDANTRGIFYITKNLRFVKYYSEKGTGEITGNNLPTIEDASVWNEEKRFSNGNYAIATPIGSGYANNDTLILDVTAGMTDTYKGKVFLTSGEVTAISITNEGENYITGKVEVTLSSPANGRTATAEATVTNGKIAAIKINDGGSGYKSAPIVTIRNNAEKVQAVYKVEIDANGQLKDPVFVNKGMGYLTEPTVSIISPVTGTSLGASAYTVVSNGEVSAIKLVNKGTGFRGNTPASAKTYTIPAAVTITGNGATVLNIDLGTGKRTIED
jgi:hypothetical protein